LATIFKLGGYYYQAIYHMPISSESFKFKTKQCVARQNCSRSLHFAPQKFSTLKLATIKLIEIEKIMQLLKFSGQPLNLPPVPFIWQCLIVQAMTHLILGNNFKNF